MKHYLTLLNINFLFLFLLFIFPEPKSEQQETPLIEDVKIELLKYAVDENRFGGATMDCSKNQNDEEEERYRVYFAATFSDFSTKKIIDFNNISLVDVDNKVRYRPIDVSKYISMSYNEWYSTSIKLEDYKYEDTFLKYSQKGIEDYDFYVYPTNKARIKNKKKPKYRYRIERESFKKKNGIKLSLSFPAFKTRKDSGNFKIYWKDKLIGEFKIVNGKPV
jgi:hypothetical protein